MHVIIIGGTKGLGRVLAQKMASRGNQVTILGRTAPDQRDLPSDWDVQWIACDLLCVDRLSEALQRLIQTRGSLHYLIFSQRYRGQGDCWEGELATTLSATKSIVEYLVSHFDSSQDNGIVMISSIFSQFVGTGQPVSYHVAKAGLDQLARFYAVNLGERGIRCNIVTPCTYLKEESEAFYLNNTPLMNLYQTMIPLRRMGTSEDIANVVCFLCSPEASFVSGQNIVVDGGLSLVWAETLGRKLTQL